MTLRQIYRKFVSVLNTQNINQQLVQSEYAVRGEVAQKIAEIDSQLKKGQKFPFSEIIQCNIGNPQALGQSPLTWIRQGLALLSYPELFSQAIFPPDIKTRCKYLLSRVKGGPGAYSESQGLLVVRETVSKYIQQRDNSGEVLTKNIFLSNGASSSISALLTTCITGPKDGILTPIPQYPIYNALTTLQNGSSFGYYLDEDNHKWSVSKSEILKAVEKAKQAGVKPKVLVIINPGNPTGQVLSRQVMSEIVEICEQEKMVLLADEVYQDNIYNEGKEFIAFRKVALELKATVELASFHTISKGYFGECGLRGGYVELLNFDNKVKEQINKLFTIMLPSNSLGQLALELALNPPRPGDASYELYSKEKGKILNDLHKKAKMIDQMLNKMKNIDCNDIEGAMYAFPSIKFSNKAKEVAKSFGMTPEKFYVLRLLEETGVALVPGCGFGQKEGTHHFRITTLPVNIDEVLSRLQEFNSKFHETYKDALA